MNNKIYIGSVQLENYTTFEGKHDFDLRDENGILYQWTVILGNNNAGKTNFLKAVASLVPSHTYSLNKDVFWQPQNASIAYDNNQLSIYCNLCYDNIQNIDNPFNNEILNEFNELWGIRLGESYFYSYDFLSFFEIYSYGVSRRFGETSLSEYVNINNSETLFDANKTLVNIEEWLLQLDYATKSNDKVAEKQLIKLNELIKSEIFPEISEVRFKSESARNFVEFQTVDGWCRLKELGYGYQTTLSWIFDLSKKLFERYPDSPNPLKEPAIVLIDELDLHLHPQWQRQIIKFISDIFTQTQFIVTTHSPFIIQSIEKINLFVLHKTDDGITVSRPSYKTFKGWSIEEILDEIHGLGEKTKSDKYISLIKQFDNALDTNNIEQAQNAYNQLCEILHPTSPERKLLKIQLSQLVPND